MPAYTVEHIETGEKFELFMSFEEFKQFLAASPDVKQVFDKFAGIGDPVKLGRMKTDDAFNDLLKTIKSKHLHSTINTR